MNELKIFENQEFGKIRTIEINDEPFFVAKDICDVLEIKNTTQAIQRLDEDERTMFNIGRQGETNLVNEYGLYNLILASRKTEAKAFKKWITHEVIPAIRKTGGYIANEENMSEDELVLKAMQVMNNKIEKLRLENTKKEQKIKELEPKANYLDNILQNKSIVPISFIAKDYGMSASKLNKILHEMEVQYKIAHFS